MATLVVRDRQMYPTGAGYDAERLVATQWREQAEAAQADALAGLPDDVEAHGIIADGHDWEAALDSLPWGGRGGDRDWVEPPRPGRAGVPGLERHDDRGTKG